MFKVHFEGGAELAKNLESLSTRLSKSLQREALRYAAEPIRKSMSAKAPVRPGKPDLRDAMVISNAMGRDSNEVAIAVGPHKGWPFYSTFQEFGTAHHPAQPFARPAFDETWRKSLEMISQDLWTSLAARGFSRSVTADTPVIGGPDGSLI